MTNEQTQAPVVCTLLPFDIRMALVRAAATPLNGDHLARAKAIDAVLAHAMATRPELFRGG